MRVIQKAKVNRASRKLMGFYRSAYDFRPPFTVVLDAGVIAAAQTRGIELKTEIPKLLGGRARLVVTRYTVKELRKRGKEAKPCVAITTRSITKGVVVIRHDGGSADAVAYRSIAILRSR